jgi:hypothetical protein
VAEKPCWLSPANGGGPVFARRDMVWFVRSVRPKRSRRLVAKGEDGQPIRVLVSDPRPRGRRPASFQDGGAGARPMYAAGKWDGGARPVPGGPAGDEPPAVAPAPTDRAGSGPAARAGRSYQEYPLVKDCCYKPKLFLHADWRHAHTQYVVIENLHCTRCAGSPARPVKLRIRRRAPVSRRRAAERHSGQRLGLYKSKFSWIVRSPTTAASRAATMSRHELGTISGGPAGTARPDCRRDPRAGFATRRARSRSRCGS